MKRVLAAAVGVLVVLAGLALGLAAWGEEGPGAEQARVEVDGAATVDRVDGTSETVSGTETLAFGEVVTMVEGTATVTLAGGQRYELRAEPSPSSLEVGSPPTILLGDVLVLDGFPAQVRYDTMTLSARGALAVHAEVPAAVSYVGRARIDGAGPLDGLSALRQVVLTPSAEPEPLTYDGADDWDRRYVGEAMAFGERLEALARGYTAELAPGGGRSVSFYEAVLPGLASEPEFGADLLDDDRSPGETLVGAAIAVQGRDGPFRQRWGEVFAFRDEGAAWGLVALDQGVSTAPLLETIEVAITAPSTPASSTTTSPTTSAPPSTTATSSPTTSSTTTTTQPPDEPEPSPPSSGLLDPVVDPVDEIVRELLGELGL